MQIADRLCQIQASFICDVIFLIVNFSSHFIVECGVVWCGVVNTTIRDYVILLFVSLQIHDS